MNIEGFITNLSSRTQSEETLRCYRQDLEKYQAFLRMKGLRATQAKPSTISEFISYLSEHHGRTVGNSISPATIARRMAVISSFYDFLHDNSDGKIKNPVQLVKRPKLQNNLPRAVDDNTLNVLIEGITDVRDLALLLVFLESGLRLEELCQLDKSTILTRKRTKPDGAVEYYGFGEVLGKGNKRREFIVGPRSLLAVRDYLRARRKNDDVPALFLSSRRQRISSRAVQHVVDKWCKRLNVAHINVHRLRHSFATRSVNAGMSATVLQQLMGHASLSTTQRYFRVRPERITREYFSVMEYVNQTS